MRRRPCSVTRHWLRDVCSSMLVSLEFTHRIWQPIRPTEVESFWLGSWHETFNRTFRLSIAVTRPKGISHESIFATSQKRMPTTAPKEKHFAFAVDHLVVEVISIVRRKSNAVGVRRRSFVPRVSVGDYFVHWEEPVRQIVRALASTPDYKRSQRARYKVEALFAELKQQIKLRKVRLRRLWNVAEQFYLAATAQNLKRLVRHLAQKQSPDLSSL